MQKYNKFIIAGVGGVIQALLLYFGSDVPTIVSTLILVATTLGVYQAPNKA